MAEVKTLDAKDVTGLRNNVADLLELARTKDLRAVVVAFRRGSDKGTRVYWNGDDVECMGLCSIADGDIHAALDITKAKSYAPLPTTEPEEES